MNYRYPIGLIEHPPNTKIGLHWYQKASNKWTKNLIDHMMMEIYDFHSFRKNIFALTSTKYIGNLNANELHLGDGKIL